MARGASRCPMHTAQGSGEDSKENWGPRETGCRGEAPWEPGAWGVI